MLFLGRNDYAMDERGRVPIPPRFRDELKAGVILAQGSPDRCVRGFSVEGFDQYTEIFLSQLDVGRQARIVGRALFASAYNVELDAQGRVLIPPPLRRYADLEGEVAVVGVGRAFEIWNAASYDQTASEELDVYAEVQETLARGRHVEPA